MRFRSKCTHTGKAGTSDGSRSDLLLLYLVLQGHMRSCKDKPEIVLVLGIHISGSLPKNTDEFNVFVLYLGLFQHVTCIQNMLIPWPGIRQKEKERSNVKNMARHPCLTFQCKMHTCSEIITKQFCINAALEQNI